MSENNELTFEDVDKLLAYNHETGLLSWKVDRGGTAKAGSVTGCANSHGHLHVRVHGKLYKAHRLAWLLHTGAWPSQQLDHADGDPSNNRIANLRECSQAENVQNQRKRSDNKSGVQGVSWHKNTNKWQAQIEVGGKNIYLGVFNTIEEAAQARAEAKAKYHQFNPVDR
ncbi:HNH homing endonuclease [Xanthomonas phage NP1]|nr:HNH homing endonuclease [Xanthomonas phage NP1]